MAWRVLNLRLSLNLSKQLSYIQTRSLVEKFSSHHILEIDKWGRNQYDVVVVGAGIVGMATAREILLQNPKLKVAVVDKENTIAAHQSSRNSGVIHAGIYYKPGSLKAQLCVEGLKLMYEYCDKRNVPYKKCGKLIVATTPEEVNRLDDLHQRGIENKVPDLEVIGPEKIRDIEPHCKGLKALYSPHTGIVDYAAVTRALAEDVKALKGKIIIGFPVSRFFENHKYYKNWPIVMQGRNQWQLINCKYVIVCAGLHSDKVAVMSHCEAYPKIVPFRGDYFMLKPEKQHLVRGNIYPVPDPNFPFLGVHFTPRMNGDIWCGPNAALAFKREGYKITDVKLAELIESLAYRGTRKLVFKNLPYAFGELYRSVSKTAFVKDLQKFIPEVTPDDVIRGPSGVRAQALDTSGNLVDDFIFDSGEDRLAQRIINVRNAPSPAATSSLAIAKMIVDKATLQFQGFLHTGDHLF